MIIDKFAYHLPLYRQHQRLTDSGITVSRQWLTQLTHSALNLLTPIHEAQLLTYLRLSKVAVGLLINFNEVLIKHGIQRVLNLNKS